MSQRFSVLASKTVFWVWKRKKRGTMQFLLKNHQVKQRLPEAHLNPFYRNRVLIQKFQFCSNQPMQSLQCLNVEYWICLHLHSLFGSTAQKREKCLHFQSLFWTNKKSKQIFNFCHNQISKWDAQDINLKNSNKYWIAVGRQLAPAAVCNKQSNQNKYSIIKIQNSTYWLMRC